ncbi:MAG: polysaccharide export protein [Alphaproteobacteria bacterium]|nr:polysaccharide export protein [Alphaproteobacteria bacterium]
MKTVILALVAIVLAGCGSFSGGDEDARATQQGSTETSATPSQGGIAVDDPSDFSRPATLSDYRLGVGDRIALRVFNNSGLNVERDIDAEGEIEVGFIGTVKVIDRTVTEVREEVARRLNDGFLVDPQVSFDVLQYRPVFVLGQVAIPGDYPFRPGLTAREAVAIAGGFTRRADTSEVTVYRKTLEGERRFDVAPGAYLRPGDIVEVGRRFI